jgi:hypothetical protein
VGLPTSLTWRAMIIFGDVGVADVAVAGETSIGRILLAPVGLRMRYSRSLWGGHRGAH